LWVFGGGRLAPVCLLGATRLNCVCKNAGWNFSRQIIAPHVPAAEQDKALVGKNAIKNDDALWGKM